MLSFPAPVSGAHQQASVTGAASCRHLHEGEQAVPLIVALRRYRVRGSRVDFCVGTTYDQGLRPIA